MACTDAKRHQWTSVPGGATYKLEVTGQAGMFTCHADFRHGATGLVETWPNADIHPGPKEKTLDSPGDTHVVDIPLTFVSTTGGPVTVKASCNGEAYCRTVTADERITHVLTMA